MNRVVLWLPRALALLFAGFVSLFALDVFAAGYSPAGTAIALLIHLIPTYLIIAALVIAWRRAWAGAILFPALALAYPLAFGWRFQWSVYVVMMGPPLLIGALFFASWLRQHPLTVSHRGGH
jgi:hypothetical protein